MLGSNIRLIRSKDLIVKSQFSFRRRYNPKLAEAYFTDRIRLAISQGKLTDTVFIDLKRAFDTVELLVVLSKLPFYNVTGNELMRIENHLSRGFVRTIIMCNQCFNW